MTLHVEVMDLAVLLAILTPVVGALVWIFHSSIRMNDFTRLGISYKEFKISIETKRSAQGKIGRSSKEPKSRLLKKIGG